MEVEDSKLRRTSRWTQHILIGKKWALALVFMSRHRWPQHKKIRMLRYSTKLIPLQETRSKVLTQDLGLSSDIIESSGWLIALVTVTSHLLTVCILSYFLLFLIISSYYFLLSTYGVYLVCCLSGPSVRNELNRDFTNFFHSWKSKTCHFFLFKSSKSRIVFPQGIIFTKWSCMIELARKREREFIGLKPFLIK